MEYYVEVNDVAIYSKHTIRIFICTSIGSRTKIGRFGVFLKNVYKGAHKVVEGDL